MKTSGIEGRELLDVIEIFGELEWARFETRRPSFEIKGGESWCEDRSGRPPFTSFRFKVESTQLIERLRAAVESYVGSVEWVMVGRDRSPLSGINWLVCPKRLLEAQSAAQQAGTPVGQYISDTESTLGPQAYDDLLGLAQYVRMALS